MSEIYQTQKLFATLTDYYYNNSTSMTFTVIILGCNNSLITLPSIFSPVTYELGTIKTIALPKPMITKPACRYNKITYLVKENDKDCEYARVKGLEIVIDSLNERFVGRHLLHVICTITFDTNGIYKRVVSTNFTLEIQQMSQEQKPEFVITPTDQSLMENETLSYSLPPIKN